MDILRTPYARDICRRLNTRERRGLRRMLMSANRKAEAEIAEMLKQKFLGRTVTDSSVDEVKQAIIEWAERKMEPIAVTVKSESGKTPFVYYL